MEIDPFLWPMLLPMIPLLIYIALKKRESLPDITGIFIVMVGIVIVYWPMTTLIITPMNIVVKCVLFVFLPCGVLLLCQKQAKPLRGSDVGLQKKGLKKSVMLSLVFLPLMLLVTLVVQWRIGVSFSSDIIGGMVSFFEAFTEEFFFRGILFLFLVPRTNLPVAYSVSLGSFILMHPQNFTSLFVIVTIVQGILTLEICRRSSNIMGSWFLHGANRLFSIVVSPFLL